MLKLFSKGNHLIKLVFELKNLLPLSLAVSYLQRDKKARERVKGQEVIVSN
jgi:hypothetical protein